MRIFAQMGAQVGCLLKAACVAVNGLAFLRGLIVYKRLPDEAIPMKFGIFGEVGRAGRYKEWNKKGGWQIG